MLPPTSPPSLPSTTRFSAASLLILLTSFSGCAAYSVPVTKLLEVRLPPSPVQPLPPPPESLTNAELLLKKWSEMLESVAPATPSTEPSSLH